MKPTNLADYKVAKGKILNYGTIRLLFSNMLESHDLDEGALYYSPKLLKYSREGGHSAWIKDGQLEVLNFNHETVEIISGSEIHYVSPDGVYIVTKSGFLLFHPRLGPLNRPALETALLEAELGQKPRVLDDSDSIKVDKRLAGERLFVLSFTNRDTGQKSEARAFTLYGQDEIECSVENPLAYSKWGEKFSAHVAK